MNENKKQELMQKLTTREVIDSYEKNKGRRRIIVFIIIVLIIGLIVVFGKKKNEEAGTKGYATCKFDDCKTFKKEFIEEVKYGQSVLSKNALYYNCGESSKAVDKINRTCYSNENNTECRKYADEKSYCYAFTKDNIDKEKNLYLTNPKYISSIKDLKSLEKLYINVNKKYKDLEKLKNEIIQLSETNENLTIYLYIDSFDENNVKNIGNINDKAYKNIQICLIDKDLCDDYDSYYDLQTAVNIINEVKKVKKDLYSKFSNPSDLEKAVYMYSYIIENYSLDEAAAKEEAELSTKNKDKIAEKKQISYLLNNKKGSHYAISSYLNILLNYVGVDSLMISSANLNNKVPHTYNQIKIDNKWYNSDISLDIINKINGTDSTEYFLKSDDDFNHADYKNDVETNKCSSTYSVDKINNIINKLK